MNNYLRISLLLLLCLLVISQVSAGAGTGVNSILESVGIEKPAQWQSWSESQKHTYLQTMGIYPQDGGKYKGSADISGFFDWLGVEKPENWETLSFEEKKSFVDEIRNGETVTEVDQVVVPLSYLKFVFIILTLFVVVASFFKYKSTMKKLGRIVGLYVLPLSLIVIALVYSDKKLFIEMGFWAERLLIFILLVNPLSVIFSSKFLSRVVTFRRELGLACYWLFLVVFCCMGASLASLPFRRCW